MKNLCLIFFFVEENLLNHPNIKYFDLDNCGKSDGYDSHYPWIVVLKYRNRSNIQNFECGGTLITDR